MHTPSSQPVITQGYLAVGVEHPPTEHTVHSRPNAWGKGNGHPGSQHTSQAWARAWAAARQARGRGRGRVPRRRTPPRAGWSGCRRCRRSPAARSGRGGRRGFSENKRQGRVFGSGRAIQWVGDQQRRPATIGRTPPPVGGSGQVQRQNPIPGTDCGTQLWGLKKKFPRFASQNGGRHMEALFPRGPTPQGESLGRLAHSPPSPVTNPEK